MDEYLKMVKKNMGIGYLSEDMIEEGIKVRDDSHEKKRDIKEKFALTRCKLERLMQRWTIQQSDKI